MTLFLALSGRYRQGLEACDPFRGDWLSWLVDPWSSERQHADLPWARLVLVMLALFGLPVACSAIPSHLLGGHLRGTGGIAEDIGFYSQFLYMTAVLALLPVARRLIGALINDLRKCGLADESLQQFDPARSAGGRVLRLAEWLTRITMRRQLIWYALLVAINLWGYQHDLTDCHGTWTTWYSNGASAQSLPSLVEHPNLAGLWLFAVVFPVGGYLPLLMARLVVVFACLCSSLAAQEELAIAPAHPDGTGGLRSVGQVALFLSLFTFVVGADLAGLTGGLLVRGADCGGPAASSSAALQGLFLLWGVYLVLGSLLFFLPLLPLRERMAAAKREYLLEAQRLYEVAERDHRRDLRTREFRPDHLQGLSALESMMEKASAMVVWPFDKKTFLQYTGLLLAPVASFVVERLPELLNWFRTHFWAR